MRKRSYIVQSFDATKPDVELVLPLNGCEIAAVSYASENNASGVFDLEVSNDKVNWYPARNTYNGAATFAGFVLGTNTCYIFNRVDVRDWQFIRIRQTFTPPASGRYTLAICAEAKPRNAGIVLRKITEHKTSGNTAATPPSTVDSFYVNAANFDSMVVESAPFAYTSGSLTISIQASIDGTNYTTAWSVFDLLPGTVPDITTSTTTDSVSLIDCTCMHSFKITSTSAASQFLSTLITATTSSKEA